MTTSTSRKNPADDPAAMFFDELGRRGHEPMLRKVSGRVLFDLVDGAHTEPWLLTVDKGDLTVARETGPADTTIRGERSLFEELVGGRKNLTAAVLRGAFEFRGDLELLIAIQRIFPDPPRGWDPAAGTRSA
jgi:ubiquinone biosynthesis protein UbiJ